MRFTPCQFKRFTFKEFVLASIGHYENENIKFEIEQYKNRQVWEVTRWQTFLILSAFDGKIKLHDLGRFDWEKVSKKKSEKPDLERIKKLADKLGKMKESDIKLFDNTKPKK